MWLQLFQVHCMHLCPIGTRYPFISSLPLFDFVPMFSHCTTWTFNPLYFLLMYFIAALHVSGYHIQLQILESSHISILHPPLLQSISPRLSFQLLPWADNGALLFPRWRDKVNPVITRDPHNLPRPLKTCRDVETTLPTNLSTIFNIHFHININTLYKYSA